MRFGDRRYWLEEGEAWDAYLLATRRFGPDRLGYELAEPVLWSELQARLHQAKMAYLQRKGIGR